VPSAPAATSPAVCAAVPEIATKPWNKDVWYEAFVRSFADGNGDGIGDFRGLTAKLDYLNDGNPATTSDLGVTGLWLMPVFASPSYHGYDVTDYSKVNPDYGTSADFAAFLTAAHRRGIKVILDLTLNHTSSQNPWFVASRTGKGPYADWYIWANQNPGYLGPEGQVVWHQSGARWYYGIFSDQMPDLNLGNPAVTAEMDAIAKHWLVDVGVDGFRLDAAKYLVEEGEKQANTQSTRDWLAAFHQSVQAEKPDAMLVGEVWDTPQAAGRYVPRSVDLTFNFGLASGTVSALKNQRVSPLVTGLMDTQTAWPPLQSAVFLTNHDQARVMSQLGGNAAAARLAAALLFAEPGVPFVYYGEEIGMQGQKPDPAIREPMPWTGAAPNAGFTTGTPWEPLPADSATVNVADETGDPASLLSLYRTLIRLREGEPALQDGATATVSGGADSVIGILRSVPGRSLLLVVNVSDSAVTDYGLTLRGGPLCGGRTAHVLFTAGIDPAAPIAAPALTPQGGLEAWKPFTTLPPLSAAIITLEPAP
jgi:glycosidase